VRRSRDEIHIALQENNQMLVESGTAKFRLLGLPAEDYPTLPTVNVTEGYRRRRVCGSAPRSDPRDMELMTHLR